MNNSPNTDASFSWHRLRTWVPMLGVLAALTVALKLPNMMTFVFRQPMCPVCNQPFAFVTTLGGAYFVWLSVVAVCFPRFPGRIGAYVGFLWALFLASYMSGGLGKFLVAPKDGLCAVCAVAHGFHILMWLIWWIQPSPKETATTNEWPTVPVRLCIAALAWLAGLGAFSALHNMMMEPKVLELMGVYPTYTYPRLPSPHTLGTMPASGTYPVTRPAFIPWPASLPAKK